jgi:hypothetical protein
MKKGPLSKAEKSYVAENHETMTATIMADKMDRSVHMVDKHIATLTVSSTDQAEVPVSIPDSSSLYVRDKNKVATIMTEAASAAGDESRKRSQMPQRYKGMIHKIKEN